MLIYNVGPKIKAKSTSVSLWFYQAGVTIYKSLELNLKISLGKLHEHFISTEEKNSTTILSWSLFCIFTNSFHVTISDFRFAWLQKKMDECKLLGGQRIMTVYIFV
jgi:hypothetical protein